jgi:hypothetical protein
LLVKNYFEKVEAFVFYSPMSQAPKKPQVNALLGYPLFDDFMKCAGDEDDGASAFAKKLIAWSLPIYKAAGSIKALKKLSYVDFSSTHREILDKQKGDTEDVIRNTGRKPAKPKGDRAKTA